MKAPNEKEPKGLGYELKNYLKYPDFIGPERFDIIKEYVKCEEKLLKEVAAKCLGREIEPEDGLLFQRIFKHGVDDRYDLAFMGKKIGVVTYDTPDWQTAINKYGVTFHPSDL